MNIELLVHESLIRSLEFTALALIIYFLTKFAGFKYHGYSFVNPKKSSLYAIAALMIGWFVIAVIFFLVAGAQGSVKIPVENRAYGIGDVINQAIMVFIGFGPAMVAMRRRNESWASVGVTWKNCQLSLGIGTLLIIFTIGGYIFGSSHGFGETVRGLTFSNLFALMQYSLVGFGEEFAFRGYLQTRLTNWLGKWQGWFIASVAMAMAHIFQRMSMYGMTTFDAVISSAFSLPFSLLAGYVMLRTENIIAPALFHTFVDWVGTLN